MENANDHPFKVSIVKDAEFFANSHPYKVTIEGGGGNEGRVVDELPEEGEPGYIYLVLKESTPEGDIYDEYMWVLLQDGETHGWEHIGATNEVKTGAAKVLTEEDYNWNSTTRSAVEPFDCIALWLLDSGIYSIPYGTTAYTHISSQNLQSFSNGLIIISSDETYSDRNVVSMISLHYSLTYPSHISGQTFTPYMYSVDKTSGNGQSVVLLNSSSVRNDLTSTGTIVPLAANQGKVLKGMIDEVDKKIGQAKVLTESDYNWNSTTQSAVAPFDSVALWLLKPGMYVVPANMNTVKISISDSADDRTMYIVGESGMWGTPIISTHISNFASIGYTFGAIYSINKNDGARAAVYNFSVVDDLDTDYTNRALSAKQGKILNDKIGQIETILQTITTGNGV